jgi:prevent-host-death family protein
MYRAYPGRMHDEIPVTEARAQLSELVNRVGFGKERIVLTRHGKPLVALVPAEILEELDASVAATPTMLDISSQTSNYGPTHLTIAAKGSAGPEAR